MAIGVVDSDGGFGKNYVATLVGKRPQANEVWGKVGMTCPNIAARGREDANARVALATKYSG